MRAARQRRTRFLVNIVAGSLFSLGALNSLQVAAVSDGEFQVNRNGVTASGRLLPALGEQKVVADGLTYASLTGLAAKAALPAGAAVANESAALEAVSANEQEGQADAREAALAALEQWAQSWRSRDVEGYLAAYGESFQPANGLGREEWSRQRRQRIGEKREIQLSLREIQIESEAAARIRVRFVQDYRADQFVERGTAKMIVMALENNVWRIQSEESLH
jgi:hypothetical protein